jgi:hypothetical protein
VQPMWKKLGLEVREKTRPPTMAMSETPKQAFINNPTDVVDEMIAGLLAVTPRLRKLAGFNVLVRQDIEVVR